MLAVIGATVINFLTSTERAYPDNELTIDVIFNTKHKIKTTLGTYKKYFFKNFIHISTYGQNQLSLAFKEVWKNMSKKFKSFKKWLTHI